MTEPELDFAPSKTYKDWKVVRTVLDLNLPGYKATNGDGQLDYEKAIEPLWKDSEDKFKNIQLFVATPVHSEVSIHYTQALIEFQQECFKKKLKVSFHLIKSSLVTQGRNLSVAGFLESKATHLLFIDSDIYFQSKSIFTMLEANKDIISVPYPLKTLMWDKAFKKML